MLRCASSCATASVTAQTLIVTLALSMQSRLTLLTVLLTIASSCCASDLPDPRITPGVIDTQITQQNIHATICVRGYSKTVRPPAYYTNALKKRQIRALGYADKNPRSYEEDHHIAISIGGHPRDERNLWPQPRNSEWGAERKDELEFVLYKMVCTNEIALNDAQHAMATDWIAAWKRYVPTHKAYRYPKAGQGKGNGDFIPFD